MWKRIVASISLLALIAFGVYSYIDENQAEKEAEAERNSGGAGMVAPNAPSGLKVGQAAPDFKLQTLDGDEVSLSDLLGEKVILNFWATWCPPCREEMPEMEKFHQEFGEEVHVLAVNTTGSETKKDAVPEFVREGGYTFPILLDKDLQVTNDYQAISIPTTYFIGTDGVIQQKRKVGPMTYEFMVEMKNALK